MQIPTLRSQFKYSTSDFTGISNPSCIKNARLFKKHLGFEIPVKSDVSYLNYYFRTNFRHFLLSTRFQQNLISACRLTREKVFTWDNYHLDRLVKIPALFAEISARRVARLSHINSELKKQYFNIAAGISPLPSNSASRVTRLHKQALMWQQ